jgi:excisionase family DNA binding protein
MTSNTSSATRSLTTGQVAARCEVSLGAVKKWIKQGKLRAARTPGGHFRVTAAEFERFRAAFRFPPTPSGEWRILVVDDERDVVETILDGLRAIRPLPQLEVAFDGYEALLKVGTFRPHVLVLDLNLPGLDGHQICRRIKADPMTRETRIVAITGDVTAASEAAAIAAGADGFFGKPFQLPALTAMVKRLLTADRNRKTSPS